MSISRREMLQRTAAASAVSATDILPARSAAGRFEPTYESLAAGYKTPDWFADAKFGIWAHWSAQCVPERGDWYARRMYQQGNPSYDFHVKTYGHPSKFGFMEIDNLWKAERWEPEKLMDLYQRAGAKYFVALANHHDNFDAYDSKYHAWNSMNVGPKRDIVGTWAKLARARGLRFGVSNHSGRSWKWFQVAQDYDAEGPLAGVRYDAYRLTKADGKGLWWDGLDPQELYSGRNVVAPDGITSIKAMDDWHRVHDLPDTTAQPVLTNPGYAHHWFLRCQDLVDKYRPDLLYFDDTGLPLEQAGLDIAAHYYNSNMQWHEGRLEAVINAKWLTDLQRRGLVQDVERGFSDSIQPAPWQTDTCIGHWHYDRSLLETHGYKSAEYVVQRLAETVAKNGNLLLSVPIRGNGEIDEDEHKILGDLAAWMAVNGEAIFATRPWKVAGEGPTRLPAGRFNETLEKPFTMQDLRFTTKRDVLYAHMLGRPDKSSVTITSLASNSPAGGGRVERVELLGRGDPLAFTATGEGLAVQIPQAIPDGIVPVLKIRGTGLTDI
jgi:alpha-L-fucosidase